MKNTLKSFWTQAPFWVGVVLVIVNSLVDSGYISLPDTTATFVNAILAAFGLGVLHIRQQRSLK